MSSSAPARPSGDDSFVSSDEESFELIDGKSPRNRSTTPSESSDGDDSVVHTDGEEEVDYPESPAPGDEETAEGASADKWAEERSLLLAQIATTEAELGRARIQVGELKTVGDMMEQNHESLRNENRKLLSELDRIFGMNQKLMTAVTANNELESEKRGLELSLEQTEERLERAKEEKKELREELRRRMAQQAAALSQATEAGCMEAKSELEKQHAALIEESAKAHARSLADLNETIALLSSRLEAAEQEATIADEQREAMQIKLADADAEVATLRGLLETYDAQRARDEHHRVEMDMRHSEQLMAAMQEAAEAKLEFEARIAEQSADIQSLLKEMEETGKYVEEVMEEKEQLGETVRRLQQELETLKESKAQMKGALSAELEAAKAAAADAKRAMDALTVEHNTVSEGLLNEMEHTGQYVEKVLAEKEQLIVTLRRLEQEMEALEETKAQRESAHSAELEKVRAEKEQLAETLRLLQLEMVALEETNARTESEHRAELEKQKEDAKRAIDALTDQHATATEQLLIQMEERTDVCLEKVLDEKNELHGKMVALRDEVEQRVKAAKQETADAKLQVQATDAQLNMMSEQLAAIEAKQKAVVVERDRLAEKLATATVQCERKLVYMRNELENAERTAAQYKKEVEIAQPAQSSSPQQEGRSQALIQKLKARLDKAQKEAADAKRELEGANAKADNLRQLALKYKKEQRTAVGTVSAVPLAAPSTARPSGYWDCPICCVANKNTNNKCDCCGESNPSSGVPASSSRNWDCPICCVANKHTNVKCDCCGESNPSSGVPASSSRNWDCPTCCVANKAVVTKCDCCGEAKPNEQVEREQLLQAAPEMEDAARLEKLQAPMDEANKEILKMKAQYEAEVQTLEQQLKETTADRDFANAAVKNMRYEIEVQEAELKKLRAASATSKDDFKAVCDERDFLRNSLKTVTDNLYEMDMSEKRMRSEVNRIVQRAERLEKELDEQKEKTNEAHEAIKSNCYEMCKQASRHRKQLAAAEESIEKLQQEKEEKEMELKTIVEQLETEQIERIKAKIVEEPLQSSAVDEEVETVMEQEEMTVVLTPNTPEYATAYNDKLAVLRPHCDMLRAKAQQYYLGGNTEATRKLGSMVDVIEGRRSVSLDYLGNLEAWILHKAEFFVSTNLQGSDKTEEQEEAVETRLEVQQGLETELPAKIEQLEAQVEFLTATLAVATLQPFVVEKEEEETVDEEPVRTVTLFRGENGLFGMMRSGTVVYKVYKGTPAEVAGVKRGDEIVSIDGVETAPLDKEDLRQLFDKAEESIELGIVYNPEKIKSLKLAKQKKQEKQTRTVTFAVGENGFFGLVHTGTSINSVEEGGPAEQGGVQRGDQMMAIDGVNVELLSEADIEELFAKARDAGSITMELRYNIERLIDLETHWQN